MLKILSIGDLEGSLVSLQKTIASIFHDLCFYTATSGSEGLAFAKKYNPDIIFLDVFIPGMDGFEVCTFLKEDENLRDIPVVLVHAKIEEKINRIRVLNVGAEGFLSVPIDDNELVAQINAMLKIRLANRAKKSEKQKLEKMLAERTEETQEKLLANQDLSKKLVESESRFRIAQEMSPDGFTILHPIRNENGKVFDFIWVYENQAIANVNGTDPNDVIGKRLLDLFPSHRGTSVFEAYVNVASTGTLQILDEVYVGEIVSVHTWLRLVIVSMGEDIAVLCQDITTHKLAELMLAESKARYHALFENCNVVKLIVDPELGSIVDANRAAVDYYGWPQEELIGKSIAEINTLPLVQIKEKLRLAMSLEMDRFQFKHRHADGAVSDVEVHCGPIPVGDKILLYSIIHDISPQVKAQHERDELSERLSHYLATSPTITYAFRLLNGEIRMQWISENVAAILGYSTQEAICNDWWFKNLFSEDRANALQGVAELTRLERYTHEYRFMKKDRTVVWLRDEMRLIRTQGVDANEVVGTLTDITQCKRAEAETSLKSAALEAAGNAIVITDRDGTIRWVNQAFVELSGYPKEDAIGKNPRSLVKSGSQDPALYTQLWDSLVSGKNWRGELINRKKSGELYDEEMLITPVLDDSGNIGHFIAIKNDITERKLSQKQLEASVREKEVLLREVHHRVKNNMQIITSLLNLSGDKLSDLACKNILGELHRRINTMAIVHEQFYHAQDLSSIDFSRYLDKLVSSIMEEYGAAPGNPEFHYRLDPLRLDLEMAIPAGLIVSELVSNAIKFSLAVSDRKASIFISLKVRAGTEVELEIRDNGPGFPEGFEPAKAVSLGMQLVLLLSQQLLGTVRTYNDAGAVVVLDFHLDR